MEDSRAATRTARPVLRSGHQRDCVGHAAIDFDVSDQALALGDGVVDAEFAQSQHRQADSQDLSGTEVTVRLGCEIQILGECLHGAIVLDSGRRVLH